LQRHEQAVASACRLEKFDKCRGIFVAKKKGRRCTVFSTPALPKSGKLDARTVIQVIAHYLPENAILADEAVSSGYPYFNYTVNCCCALVPQRGGRCNRGNDAG